MMHKSAEEIPLNPRDYEKLVRELSPPLPPKPTCWCGRPSFRDTWACAEHAAAALRRLGIEPTFKVDE